MKRFITVLLVLSLLLTACTAVEETVVTTDTKTSITGTAAETEKETETETTAAETDEPAVELTRKPSVKGQINIEPGRVMVYGKCENESVISVKTAHEEFSVKADGENFVFSVQVKKGEEEEVTVYASADGKPESEKTAVTVKYNKNAKDTGVAVTNASRVIETKVLEDQYGTNKFTDKQIETIKKLAKSRVEKAEKAAGKAVKTVYIIVPDPLTVYEEEMTEDMKESVVEFSARRLQAVKTLEETGVTVIDLYDTLVSKKSGGKLYYKLDSHWTELGAFYGYEAVMDKLKLPHFTREDYKIDLININDTDMTVYSGVGAGKMFEKAPFLNAEFEEKTPYGISKDDTARIWGFVDEFFSGKNSVTTTDNAELPSALFLFDSYGLNIISYFAESFNVFAAQPVWSYGMDADLVKEVKPDYVIELLAERDLADLLKSA